MLSNILDELRACSPNLKNAIILPPVLENGRRLVTVKIITDETFRPSDKAAALAVIKKYVPSYFGCAVEISKLAPDADMVRRRIYAVLCVNCKAVYSAVTEEDISVEKEDKGFSFTVSVPPSLGTDGVADKIVAELKKSFCGEFRGRCVASARDLSDLEIEEIHDEIEYEIPMRTFPIEEFEFLEGDKIQKSAVYLSDLNFASEEVVICGTVEDIRERTYTNKKGQEKNYLSIILNDGTASAYITYFIRQKNAEKITKLKTGDSIVCTGANEEYKGNLSYTAKTIDYGKPPAGFVPEKRKSKPVPVYYHHVQPQPFSDIAQTDLFSDSAIPECMKDKTFVVFDLETTGLNSSPVSGNMDKIIEIGAFKIENGEITQSFSTFIDPERKLSEEIIALTGITPDMVAGAPKIGQVMPDFFKFCDGCILVGHNIVGFDYKFVDYYCAKEGYLLERRLIDTIGLSQELLFLSNYKLNTVAEKFNITFNHHRAIDDALATAKIFIELIKIKKSLPKLQ